MAFRLYYRPNDNLTDSRKKYLEEYSNLLEIALFYISQKELEQYNSGNYRFIEKKQFGGKLVKKEYHSHVFRIFNKIRMPNKDSLSLAEARYVIEILQKDLNEENDFSIDRSEIIDYIFELTGKVLNQYKNDSDIKRLLKAQNNEMNSTNSIETYPLISKEQRYYWLNVDPTGRQSFSTIRMGSSHTYSNLNSNGNRKKKESCFNDIKIGDLAVSYETGNLKAITSVCKVIDKYKEDNKLLIEFQKVNEFLKPLDLEILKTTKALEDCEVVFFHRGTLFELEKEHFDSIINMLHI